MNPRPLPQIRRTISVSVSLALLVACSSSKPKEEAPIVHADAAQHDAKAKVPPPPKPPECRSPAPVILTFDPSETGFASCEGGVWHRPAIHSCPTRLPRTLLCGFAPVEGGTLNGSCRADSDCTTKPKGYCGVTSANASCHCDYGCTEDADCGAGYICQCGDPLGKCLPATCKSDAECPGLLCLRSRDKSCGETYACQAATDLCTSNSDCKAPLAACTIENGLRTCQAIGGCK
jgi:hypothetical protein